MAGLSLSGLASGVDTASIVDQLMALERQSLTKINYRKAAVTGQQDALKEVASKLSAFKDAALALSANSTWTHKQTVESSDPTRLGVAMLAGAGIGGTTVSVDRLASAAQRHYDFTASAFVDGKTTSAQTLTLYYDNDPTKKTTISFAAGATKQQIADAINAKTDGPAVAALVKDAGGVQQLVLSARKTGQHSGFTVDPNGAFAAPPGYTPVPATDLRAAIRVGGGSAQYFDSNVIEDSIPGVRLTLKGVTASPAAVTVTEPALDRDAIKGKLKSFVDAYNAVVDTVRGKLTEQKAKNPTSEFQAARGQLYGDSGLSGMLSRLREDMGDVIDPDGIKYLSDIGIVIPKSTGGAASADAKAGKLVLDEAKLTDALDSDFTKVKDFLGIFSGKVGEFVKAQTGGSGVIDDRITGGDRAAKRVQDQIERANERLDAREKRLRAQFAAMELALQKSQTQSTWLQGQLAGLNANK